LTKGTLDPTIVAPPAPFPPTLSRRREERARERAVGADGGDSLAGGAGVMEAEVINPLEPPSKDPDRILSV